MRIDYQAVSEIPVPGYGYDVSFYEDMAGTLDERAGRLRLAGLRVGQSGETRETRAARIEAGRRAPMVRQLAREWRDCAVTARLSNFLVCLKIWVLSCAQRRLAIRWAIGEAAIKRWYDKLSTRLQAVSKGEVSVTGARATPDRQAGSDGIPRTSHRDTPKDSVQKWYKLAAFPPLPCRAFPPGGAHQVSSPSAKPDVPGVSSNPAGDKPARTRAHRTKPARTRAFPALSFFPWELDGRQERPGIEAPFCWRDERPEDENHINSRSRTCHKDTAQPARHLERPGCEPADPARPCQSCPCRYGTPPTDPP